MKKIYPIRNDLFGFGPTYWNSSRLLSLPCRIFIDRHPLPRKKNKAMKMHF